MLHAVSRVATLIGAKLGVASGVVTPLVTWLFLVTRRIGEDAVCLTLSAAPTDSAVQPRSSYA